RPRCGAPGAGRPQGRRSACDRPDRPLPGGAGELVPGGGRPQRLHRRRDPGHLCAGGRTGGGEGPEPHRRGGTAQGRSMATVSGAGGGALDGPGEGEGHSEDQAGEQIALRERESYQEIVSRAPEHKISPTIDRVAQLIDLLGSPQRSYRAIHITGTNGKTSTSRMVERLLREMGLRTGRFTSPHLHTVRERIAIDGEPISPEQFVATWEEISPYVQMVDAQLQERGHSPLNFFEILTAMAYAAFADAPVDVAVIEVGLGGEWDSTNVIDGEVAVFTPIARDHERWLGHSLEEIATIKAGIIKRLDPPATVVTAEQDEDVAVVLAQRAVDQGARVIAQGFDIEVAERTV